jgi:uncharacterized protein YacL
MNINRVLWVATTALFCITGALAGWAIGAYYAGTQVGGSDFEFARKARPFVIGAITLGLTVVMTRIGASLGNRIVASIDRVQNMSVADRVLGIIGLLIGLFFGVLITIPFSLPPDVTTAWSVFTIPLIKLCIMAVSAMLGVALFQGMQSEMLRVFPALDENAVPPGTACPSKILDTNVIIDGRIADLCRTGFIEGAIWVPAFVLHELQYIADSSDSLRRARGRRGLESLNAIRTLTLPGTDVPGSVPVPMVQVLTDIPSAVAKIETVDAKLVALAKELGASIITNDYNLNRVAELQDVKVLNLNEMALALKPVVLPGEEMALTLVREGKEQGQAVGYLEDGTMVVVSDARTHIGETCKVTISQVLQTVAGKMIFAEMKGPKGAGDDLFNDGGHGGGFSSRHDDHSNRSGGGMRRKGKS